MQQVTTHFKKIAYSIKFGAAARGLLILALSLVGIMAPSSQNVAQANAGYAYSWKLEFDFEHDERGILSIEVGHNDNGMVQQPPIHSKQVPVKCESVGSVIVSGGVARFNGGYLQCELDLQTALETAIVECQAIVSDCKVEIPDTESYPNIRMAAIMYSTVAGKAPIFYHEDASYTATLEDASASQPESVALSALLSSVGTVNGTPFTSPEIKPPTVLKEWQTYSSLYLCEIGCEMQYGVSGAAQTIPLPGDGPVDFTTTTTQIYVGHNLATGDVLPAGTAIDYLFLDPPKFGNN